MHINTLSGPAIATARIMYYLDLPDPKLRFSKGTPAAREAKKIEELIYGRLLCALHPNSFSQVIFLDIDGVLFDNPNDGTVNRVARQMFPDTHYISSFQFHIATSTRLFSTTAVANLNTIITKAHSVAIVISSFWREDRSVRELREMFATHAFAKYIIDKTSELPFKGRVIEIQQWLKMHPNVAQFGILDDNSRDDCGNEFSKAFGKKFVHVNDRKLLTQEDTDKALNVLAKTNV